MYGGDEERLAAIEEVLFNIEPRLDLLLGMVLDLQARVEGAEAARDDMRRKLSALQALCRAMLEEIAAQGRHLDAAGMLASLAAARTHVEHGDAILEATRMVLDGKGAEAGFAHLQRAIGGLPEDVN